jgi:hypothetical protein
MNLHLSVMLLFSWLFTRLLIMTRPMTILTRSGAMLLPEPEDSGVRWNGDGFFNHETHGKLLTIME